MLRHNPRLHLSVTATLAIALICTQTGAARAQENDLVSSAGVFIEPPSARRHQQRREKMSAQQRAIAPRRKRVITSNPQPPVVQPPVANNNTGGKKPDKPPVVKKPTVTAESLNAKGEAASSTGKHEEAARSFREALRLNPAYEEAQSNLGFSLYQLGKYPEAISQLC